MRNTNGQINKGRKNHKAPSPSLGPVSNLEEYLKPDWWRRIFNSMYLKTDADVVEDKNITAYELDMFTAILRMSKDQTILDLACGQGRHSLELARRGFARVYGLDRSHYLINKAKQANQNEGLPVIFREGDARKLPYPTDNFDVVMILGNSFGYFESMEDDIKILHEVLRVLKPQGRFLIDVADGNYLRDNFNPRSWEWIDKNHFVCRERSLAGDNERLISREVISNIKKGVIVDQFYAERLYTRENLKDILHKSGFRNIQLHNDYRTGSERKQDLGMMERRIIMTAEAIKTWSPVKQRIAGSKNVVVILGDPSKKDIIKPDTVFDEDDYNTLDQLKIALSSLKDYKFTYLGNHDTLITSLIRLRPQTDFVLNLCDEGFNNDPRYELHVPAMLEMLKIPYSGSNPQCLAYCYDKSLIRGIAKEMDIPVAEAFYIKPEDNIFEMNIEFPVIAKPNFGDSSFGITQHSVAYNIEQLNNAIILTREKLGYDKPILVEEFLTGKDLTVGIIGNPPESYTTLPVIEEDYSLLPDEFPRICGYEAKWLQESPYFKLLRSVEAKLDTPVRKQIIAWCLKLSERLECRDYVRFDWRLDAQGSPKLLEINPNPGWCWDGHLAKMSGFKGIDYPGMLKAILEATEQRVNAMVFQVSAR
ncbi:MAG: methyltransferase domain-containing protein [Bacteroidales bacterium]|nr:methyltransferase domain-containing protein [Bacteroidales bacterium]